MRIAILETGYPPSPLVDAHGTYPDMLRRWLGPDFDYEVIDVVRGPPPPDAAAYDAVAVMGSPAAVYETDPWIGRLLHWLRDQRGRAPMLGVCFGHQALAQAWGGEVRKSDAGWGLGLHSYDVVSREPWMAEPVERIAIPVSHQDQVLTRPPSARVVARSNFTPHAVLAYGDEALSFQCHPEFTVSYAQALVERRRGQVADEHLDSARSGLEADNDNPVAAAWVRRFLAGSAARRGGPPAATAAGRRNSIDPGSGSLAASLKPPATRLCATPAPRPSPRGCPG